MDRVDGSCAVNAMHVLVVELLHVPIVPKTTLVTETFIFLFNFFSLTTFTRASNQLTATSRKIDGFGSYFSWLGCSVSVDIHSHSGRTFGLSSHPVRILF